MVRDAARPPGGRDGRLRRLLTVGGYIALGGTSSEEEPVATSAVNTGTLTGASRGGGAAGGLVEDRCSGCSASLRDRLHPRDRGVGGAGRAAQLLRHHPAADGVVGLLALIALSWGCCGRCGGPRRMAAAACSRPGCSRRCWRCRSSGSSRGYPAWSRGSSPVSPWAWRQRGPRAQGRPALAPAGPTQRGPRRPVGDAMTRPVQRADPDP